MPSWGPATPPSRPRARQKPILSSSAFSRPTDPIGTRCAGCSFAGSGRGRRPSFSSARRGRERGFSNSTPRTGRPPFGSSPSRRSGEARESFARARPRPPRLGFASRFAPGPTTSRSKRAGPIGPSSSEGSISAPLCPAAIPPSSRPRRGSIEPFSRRSPASARTWCESIRFTPRPSTERSEPTMTRLDPAGSGSSRESGSSFPRTATTSRIPPTWRTSRRKSPGSWTPITETSSLPNGRGAPRASMTRTCRRKCSPSSWGGSGSPSRSATTTPRTPARRAGRAAGSASRRDGRWSAGWPVCWISPWTTRPDGTGRSGPWPSPTGRPSTPSSIPPKRPAPRKTPGGGDTESRTRKSSRAPRGRTTPQASTRPASSRPRRTVRGPLLPTTSTRTIPIS